MPKCLDVTGSADHARQDRKGTAIDLKRLLRRPRTFEGGLYLPSRSERTVGRPIEAFPPPPLLRVPMQQHDGPASTMVVQVGQQVEAGECLGRADEPGAVSVHAPVAGRVVAIDRVDTARHCDVPAVVIKPIISQMPLLQPDDPPLNEEVRPKGAVFLVPDLTSVQPLAQVCEEAGVIDCRASARGFGRQLREAASHDITDVIINAMDSEPMLTADRQLFESSVEAILRGSVWVRDALRARRVWLAMDRTDRSALRRYRAMAAGMPVRVVGLRNKYPQSASVLLTWSILERTVPYGRLPEEVGVFVVEVPTLAALAIAVKRHEPMTHRVVTVTGSAVQRPGHYEVPIGTTFADVLRHVGIQDVVVRVVDGGPMTGQAVESLDAVVTKQTSAVLVSDRNRDRIALPGPCVRCGWCQEDCPVGLDPQALLDLMERGCFDEASRWYPHACVECGLCSYVCPVELPLAEAVRQLKQRVAIGELRAQH